jgi:hypothetical protein
MDPCRLMSCSPRYCDYPVASVRALPKKCSSSLEESDDAIAALGRRNLYIRTIHYNGLLTNAINSSVISQNLRKPATSVIRIRISPVSGRSICPYPVVMELAEAAGAIAAWEFLKWILGQLELDLRVRFTRERGRDNLRRSLRLNSIKQNRKQVAFNVFRPRRPLERDSNLEARRGPGCQLEGTDTGRKRQSTHPSHRERRRPHSGEH